MSPPIQLHRNASGEKLGVVRIVVFGLVLVYALSTPLERLALFPPDIFEPRGVLLCVPAQLRAQLQSHEGLSVLRWTLVGLSLACSLGLRGYRFLAPLCALAFVSFEATLSMGANSHRELLLVYCTMVLAFVPAHASMSLNRTRTPRCPSPALPLNILTFALLLTYSATGLYRLAHGAPDVFFDHSMAAHLISNAGRNGAFGWDFGQSVVEHLGVSSAVLGAALFGGTLLETAAFGALLSDRFRVVFTLSVLAFHTANLFLLNIEFFLNCGLVLLLLLDWDPWKSAPAPAVTSGAPQLATRSGCTRAPSAASGVAKSVRPLIRP